MMRNHNSNYRPVASSFAVAAAEEGLSYSKYNLILDS